MVGVLTATLSIAAAAPAPVAALIPLEPKQQVQVGGEFGRRIRLCIESNMLQVDVEKTFLPAFQKRGGGGYLGFGKFLDGTVRLAAHNGDERMIALKQRIIGELLATQDADGYLGTVKNPAARIRALWDLHEDSYLMWALVSDYNLFGEKTSLAVARRLADNLTGKFLANPALRPDSMNGVVTFEGSDLGFDRALLALSVATGDPKYRDFVIHFLKLNEFDPPIHCGPTSLANHAYSCLGHCLAQLDLYRVTGDADLLQTSHRVVDFLLANDGLLVTGSCGEGECWHDTQSGLENTAESCTGIYTIRLMDSLLQLEGNSLYGDVMERTIYNAVFAAVAADGRHSRYFTPFEGPRELDPHGDTFCCVNNLRRFFGDLSGWIYYRTTNGVAVNLYTSSAATIELSGDLKVKLTQQTDYPTSGNVRLQIEPSQAAKFPVQLRIPRWCAEAAVSVNGGTEEKIAGGHFYAIDRIWQPGDQVELKMPMNWRFVKGRKSQDGRVAVMRGPELFTLNPARNPALAKQPLFDVRQLMIDPTQPVESMPDDSVRPGGIAAKVKAWPPGPHHFWPFIPKVDLILSEFPDDGGKGVYFIVPDSTSTGLVADELLLPHQSK